MLDPLASRQIDEAILSLLETRWQKVAMIVAKSADKLASDGRHVEAEDIAERVLALSDVRRIEAAGDLRNWRRREIRRADDAQ